MIVIDPAKCSGCRRCEVNCAFFHTGRVGRASARIKVVKLEALGIDYPVVCRHCVERFCNRCPESAIEIGPLGQVLISPTLCTACGTCERLCPIGAIEIYGGIPHVCDLCGGEPRCVAQCTMGAITFAPAASGTVSLKPFREKARGATTEARRVCFALAETQVLRETWIAERGRS
jgi:Fe-S-cluster-containing hydrogenase component 2